MFKFYQDNKVVFVKETSEVPPCMTVNTIEEDTEHSVSDYVSTPENGYVLFHSAEAIEMKKKKVRSVRNSYLKETDVFMLTDYPVSDEEREKYKSYRAYLRTLPEKPDFPDIDVKTFSGWKE